MKQTTSIRLSKIEKENINEAIEKLGMSMTEYFVRLHYAFWDVAKNIIKNKEQQHISKEYSLIKKLKDLGIIENAGDTGRG